MNYLTIDVEDYFQVSAFEKNISFDKWDSYPPRVEINIKKIINILCKAETKATFFILGWIAKKFPNLVKEISDNGHEIGCHSYQHRLIYNLTPDEFKEDTLKAKDILEQTCGQKVVGYRAPSFSIGNNCPWAIDILEELGFTYDSSMFPIRHDLYGFIDTPRFRYTIPGSSLVEYPLTTALLLGYRIPVAGGGYFRLFPYWFTKLMLKRVNDQDKQPFIFYMHPWEIDPQQPRIRDARWKSRFRHYNNLTKTGNRLERLLGDFEFGPIHQN